MTKIHLYLWQFLYFPPTDESVFWIIAALEQEQEVHTYLWILNRLCILRLRPPLLLHYDFFQVFVHLENE